MQGRIWMIAVVALAVTAVVGCQQPQRADSADQSGAQAASARTIGWDRIARGQDPAEVFDLLGEPMQISVTKLNTFWYYSARGQQGPRVVFDTRTMHVERWQAPEID